MEDNIKDSDLYYVRQKIKLLMDILDYKLKYLNQIYNITENQNIFEKLLSGNDKEALMKEAIDEKQKIIQSVIAADDAFINVFSEFKGKLNDNQNYFKQEINTLKNKIKAVADLDFKIRAKELRAKQGIKVNYLSVPKKINALKSSKNYIINKYRSNKKNN